MKFFQMFQKKAVKRRLRNADVDGTVLKAQGASDVLLAAEDLFAGRSDIVVESWRPPP